MATHPDLLIVGGGIIGLTTAYFAAKAGLRVAVCDRSDLGQEASWAGAGILPPGDPRHAATPIDKLRAIGSVGMADFAAELLEATGLDNGYRPCGGIECLGPEDDYALELWAAERIRCERLSLAQMKELEPHVAPLPGEPYLLPDCAQVRNPWHLRALIAACERTGVQFLPRHSVVGWVFDGTRVLGVGFTDGQTLQASRFLLAAGSWSEGLLEPLGHSPGVRPVLGQIVLLKPAGPVLSRVLMVGKEYLVPRAEGRVLVGSTEEPEAGFEKRTTPRAAEHLREFAVRLVPALRDAVLEKSWAGLRPGTADGLPLLGTVPGSENVLIATGHFRAGVQLSLGTARVTTELLTNQPLSVPIDGFRLDRKPEVPARPAFRS